MKFFESLGEYKSNFVVVLFCSTIVGFILGLLKGIAYVGAHRFLEHKMYYLTLYWLSSITSQYLLIALGVGISALIVLMATQAFLKSVSTNVKLNNLIVVGVVPSLLMFIVGGYWINKIYLPGFYEFKSIVGNAIWVVACVIIGWLILRMSQTKFVSYLRIFSLRIIVTIICLVVAFNGARYLYLLSLESGRSNLILISIDTLRADHLGCYGYNRNTSPNIDRFAKDGVLFSNTIAQSSWTLPSHMSMLTGLYPTSHGVLSPERKLNDEYLTLAEILQNAGYKTVAFTDGGYLRGKYGYQGFDFFDDKPIESWGSIERTYTKAVNWLRKNNSSPFFLFLHTYQVHAPYNPSPQYDVYSDKNYRGILEATANKVATDYHRIQDKMKLEDYTYLVDKYDGDIYYTDDFFGKLFKELRDLGLYDRSIIVLTSDHGENFLDHKAYKIGHIELYDEIVKVPLIIKAPAFPRKHIVEAQVESMDIMPTVLELLGISIPKGLDGESLAELTKKGSYNSTFAFSEKDYDYRMIRSEDWKLLLRAGNESKKSEIELYNLKVDSKEQNNLFAQEVEIGKSLFAELQAWMGIQKGKSKFVPTDKIELDENLKEQLKALGYMN